MMEAMRMRKKHFSEKLAERASPQQHQDVEDRDEAYETAYERTQRMWERIAKRQQEQQ